MKGWECTGPMPTFIRQYGELTCIVHIVGPGALGQWGFSIWDGGRCVQGQSDPDWYPVLAAKKAAEAAELATNPPSFALDVEVH